MLVQARLFALDQVHNDLLRNLEGNHPLDTAAEQSGMSMDEASDFLKVLEETGAGFFSEYPYFVEKIRPFDPIEDFTYYRRPFQVPLLHIVLPGKCSQNCRWCYSDGLVFRLKPCLGCSFRLRNMPQTLTLDQIRKALVEARLLGCQRLKIHTWDFAQVEDLVIETASIAVAEKIGSIELFTNAPLPRSLIDDLAERRIVPVFQVYSHRKKYHDSVTGQRGGFARMVENFRYMERKGLSFRLFFISTGVGPAPSHVVRSLTKFHPSDIYQDRFLKGLSEVEDYMYGEKSLVPPGVEEFILKQKGGCCRTGRLTLGPDGSYRPCPGDPREIGHVAIESIHSLFQRGLIQPFWEGRDMNGAACGACEFRFACHPCPVVIDQLKGECPIGYDPSTSDWGRPTGQ